MRETLGCAGCNKDMTQVLGGDVVSLMSAPSVYYCENKECKRVYLLAVGGVSREAVTK